MLSRRKQAGFNLIEVVLSAFFLAVCLLATIKMQNLASKSSVEARQLHQASRLGKDMLERIQSNQAWLSETTDTGYTLASLKAQTFSKPGCVQTSGLRTSCDGASIRDHDFYQWQQEVNSTLSNQVALPGVDACIAQDAATGEIVVAVTWKGQQARGDAADAVTSTLAKTVATNCGTASQRRRMVLMSTIIG